MSDPRALPSQREPACGHGYTAQKLAAAFWDAREARDPSGELVGVTMTDQTRAPVFWEQAVRENLWPASREDAIREAQLAIELMEQMPDD